MTDPFGPPGPAKLPDRGDPFGVPSDSGRATRMGGAEDRAEVPRDQWDRYLMPHMDGTKPAANKGFTRVSTTKAALSNTFGIQDWAKRRVVEGIASDPNLVTEAIRAHAMPDGKDKEKALRRVASAGFDLGGGKERSGLGTEFHELTEAENRGDEHDGVDPKWLPELTAYRTMLAENNITVLPEYLERQVMCPFNQAGTFDNIVRMWNPDTDEWELLIADLKTGRSLDLGWLEILMQLWCYANAYGMWTTTRVLHSDLKDPSKITDVEGFWEPMPRELRTDKALIFHTPLDGTASLYVLDISGVERYVRAAVEAKRANAEAKNKVTKVSTYRPEAFVARVSGPITAQPFVQTSGPQSAASQANVELVAAMSAPLLATDDDDEPLSIEQAVGFSAVPGEGSFTEEKNPYGLDPHAYPTKDAFTQALKAAERQAVAADVVTRVAAPPELERDPITGRKKRTCGHCHKPGHTQKNCPENPASAKYNPQVVRAVAEPVPAGDPAPENNCDHLGDGDWHPYVAGSCPYKPDRLIKTESTPNGKAETPWCDLPHVHEWTGQHPDAPKQWVCSVSGKPGRQAYETGRTAVTDQPPAYGAPGFDAETLAAVKPLPTWPELPPADQTLLAIAQAETAADVLRIRQEAIHADTWVEATHDAAGQARYTELS